MSHLGAEFSHLVDLIDSLVGDIVDAVEIRCVHRDTMGESGLLHRKNCLEDGALAILDPLAHRVKVGGEIHRCRENALAILTLALAVKLFPPLREIVELGIEVYENLDLLAALIESVAETSILLSGVLGRGVESGLLHILGSFEEFLDIMTCASDREKTHGSEHRETAANVVGDYVSFVTFLVGHNAECALLLVGDSHDEILGCILACLLLKLILEETESDSRLSGCS